MARTLHVTTTTTGLIQGGQRARLDLIGAGRTLYLRVAITDQDGDELVAGYMGSIQGRDLRRLSAALAKRLAS